MNWLRIIFAFAIVPVSVGFTLVLADFLFKFSPAYIPFFLGIICYTLVYPVFRKPLLGYVIGHELTHVLGVWLFRGKVHSVKVGRHGGMVRTDKANVWIALLPYFLPLYTVLVLSIYYLLSILWNMEKFFGLMVFLLGVTWAFHIWMTLYIVRHNQPDIKESGVLFSTVVIFTTNVMVLTILLIFISPELTIKEFFSRSFTEVKLCYLWIINKLV